MSQTQFKIKTTRNGGLGLAMAGRGPAKPLRQRGRRADSNKWQTQSGRHSVLDSVRPEFLIMCVLEHIGATFKVKWLLEKILCTFIELEKAKRTFMKENFVKNL